VTSSTGSKDTGRLARLYAGNSATGTTRSLLTLGEFNASLGSTLSFEAVGAWITTETTAGPYDGGDVLTVAEVSLGYFESGSSRCAAPSRVWLVDLQRIESQGWIPGLS
jgi:hypothetical protein